jgi:hypothetical protein
MQTTKTEETDRMIGNADSCRRALLRARDPERLRSLDDTRDGPRPDSLRGAVARQPAIF